jgi:PilZ domain
VSSTHGAGPGGPAFGPEGLERRRAPRIPIPPSAPLSVVGARLLNASVFGMLIESPVSMERDALLRLRLVIAREKFDVETRVAACTAEAGRPGVFGVGLEFAGLPEKTREKLRALLRGLPDPQGR